MGFLNRMAVLAGDDYIALDDVYREDPQYQQLINTVENILYKLANKFKISEEKMLELFIKHLHEDF